MAAAEAWATKEVLLLMVGCLLAVGWLSSILLLMIGRRMRCVEEDDDPIYLWDLNSKRCGCVVRKRQHEEAWRLMGEKNICVVEGLSAFVGWSDVSMSENDGQASLGTYLSLSFLEHKLSMYPCVKQKQKYHRMKEPGFIISTFKLASQVLTDII